MNTLINTATGVFAIGLYFADILSDVQVHVHAHAARDRARRPRGSTPAWPTAAPRHGVTRLRASLGRMPERYGSCCGTDTAVHRQVGGRR